MNILTLKVGDKYGPEYVNRLYYSIKNNTKYDFDFYCYTEDKRDVDPNIKIIPLHLREDVKAQWYKLDFHSMVFEGITLIIDIDQIVVNSLDPIFEYKFTEDQFVSAHRWWSDTKDICPISGGLLMYHGGTTKHLYTKFYENPVYFQKTYIEQGKAFGPINGEQNFVYENCDLEFVYLPDQWVGKYSDNPDEQKHIRMLWDRHVDPNDPYIPEIEPPEQTKFIHFSNSNNNIDRHKWVTPYLCDSHK